MGGHCPFDTLSEGSVRASSRSLRCVFLAWVESSSESDSICCFDIVEVLLNGVPAGFCALLNVDASFLLCGFGLVGASLSCNPLVLVTRRGMGRSSIQAHASSGV